MLPLLCPDCPTARAARASILDDPDRWTHALYMVLPFVVVTFAIVCLHHLWGARRR